MSAVSGRRLIGALAVGACALAGVTATSGTSEAAKNGPTMDIQILSFNTSSPTPSSPTRAR